MPITNKVSIEVKNFVFFKFGNIHLQKYFLNSLFGVVPVGRLFREKGDFALKSGYFEKMQVRDVPASFFRIMWGGCVRYNECFFIFI